MPEHLRQKGKAFYYDHGGKPRRWEPLGSDRSKALIRWAEIQGGKKQSDTVGHIVRVYLANLGPLAESTKLNYRKSAALILKCFDECPTDQMQAHYLTNFINEYKSKQMARNAALFLKTVYAWAFSTGRVKTNPFLGLRFKGQSRRDRYLTDEEFRLIRTHLSIQFQIAADLAYLLGLRVSGVVALKFSDIKDGVLSFHPKKSKKPIHYRLNDEVLGVIERARALPGSIRGFTVICNRYGKPYSTQTVSQAFTEAAKKAGVEDARFHDIRAKSASDDATTAQGRLGHTDAKTTAGYLRKPQIVTPIKGLK